MTFELKNVAPWGRNLEEYSNMFNLHADDFNKRIISFGDGPASFNFEMRKSGKSVISLDPIYQFSETELKQRISETKDIVIQQVEENMDNFIWTSITSINELEEVRMDAMSNFMSDYNTGKEQKRYIYHELPDKTEFREESFDLGLSSHFLILYSNLGLDFHLKSISEMLRICKEVRIFPLVNLNSETSEVLDGIINYYNPDYLIEIVKVNYEFQKGGDKMLKISK
jgi:hypothetical protein